MLLAAEMQQFRVSRGTLLLILTETRILQALATRTLFRLFQFRNQAAAFREQAGITHRIFPCICGGEQHEQALYLR